MKSILLCNAIALVAALGLSIPCTAMMDMNGINVSIITGCLIAILFSLPIILGGKNK